MGAQETREAAHGGEALRLPRLRQELRGLFESGQAQEDTLRQTEYKARLAAAGFQSSGRRWRGARSVS